MNGFYKNSIYYTVTESLNIEVTYWKVLDKTNLLRTILCPRKNVYSSGGVFCGLFLAPKFKKCSTIYKFGFIREHKTFKGFKYSKRLLGRSQYFKMIEGKKI